MNKKLNIEELVTKYLEGEMSDLEKLNFENQLVNNPAIREEFQFQKDIIEGIQEYRKAELKARLDNIQVPGSNIYQYIGLKVAALVTITTMLGFGAYFTFFDNTEPEEKSLVVIDEKATDDKSIEVPEMPKPVEEESLDTEEIVIEKPDRKEQRRSDKEKRAAKNKKEEEKSVEEQATVNSLPSPNIVKPESVESVAEDNVNHKDDSFEISNTTSDLVGEALENKVEVAIDSEGNKDFHYQFYNRKLFLYGDFEKMPYEILEYNTDKNTLYFLFYEGAFYELNSNQMKISPLKEIEDPELIEELKNLRN